MQAHLVSFLRILLVIEPLFVVTDGRTDFVVVGQRPPN